jgi:MFS family permease
MGAFGMLGVSPLLPNLVEGFRLTRLDVAFVVPSVYLGGLLSSLPAGHLADRWGVRLLLGAPAFGLGLEARDSYAAAWAVFAALSALVALLMALAGGAIHRECGRARGGA